MNKYITKLVLPVMLVGGAICQNAFSGTEYLTGNVIKIRTHQHTEGGAWDKESWFCLNKKSTLACGTEDLCQGNTVLMISKDAAPNVFSMVLAASMAKTELTVFVDDAAEKMGSYCYARMVDM